MTPEDVARRFERRHGYELVDYAEVALPLYRLTVDVVTMVHREIPPIKEFVMRAVALGLNKLPDISGFLGLDEVTVAAVLETLQAESYLLASDDGGVGTISDGGREVLVKLRESSPQDEMLVFLYDRLLLKPVRLGPEQLMVPINIDPARMVEIRPYPAEGPEIGEISLSDVAHTLEEQAGGRSAFGRNLLHLKRVVRRIRLYRPAVALVYKKMRSSEVQIAFIVDDARHEGLEHAFAERGGPKKMGFVKSIDESATAAELRRYLGGEVIRLLPDAATLDEKRIAVSLARLKHQTAETRLQRAGDKPSQDMREAVDITSGSLQAAQEDLQKFVARPVAPYELTELLEKALSLSEHKLLISSRTLDGSVVDSKFLKGLIQSLDKGVRVSIALNEIPMGAPAVEIEKLRKRYPSLEVTAKRKGQFHYLVSDDYFAAVSNRPFLSNFTKVRSFHHVVGYILQEAGLVDAFTKRVGALGDVSFRREGL